MQTKNKIRLAALMLPVLAVVLFAGCDSGPGQGSNSADDACAKSWLTMAYVDIQPFPRGSSARPVVTPTVNNGEYEFHIPGA